ncbi:hypothetical protein D9757_001565 [Collybiopsis confluens]|uniref:Glycosyltransferase 61 catalytic domain-containing protein n=1 Tax=Collybiopsis confluens TaxID=2823264 RepID=A0A8H5HZP3_9AGAR|nr:hypothetical protein D9757_001565 [Collybiopsis confluens]
MHDCRCIQQTTGPPLRPLPSSHLTAMPARPRQILIALAISASCFLLLASLNSPRLAFPKTYWKLPFADTDGDLGAETSDPAFDNAILDYPYHPNSINVPVTKIPGGAHSYGFTILDNIYLRNGTFFIVTPDASGFPQRQALLSAPFDLGESDLTANSSHLQFIDPQMAMEKLGTSPVRIDDFTVVLYDPKQFMTHYYHWWGEIMLGFWRVYSMLGVQIDGSFASLPFPKRFLLPFVVEDQWRDRAGINGPLLRAANPQVSIETSGFWNDLIALDETVVFSRIALINRAAAHKHRLGSLWFKMMASSMELPVPVGYWEPLRHYVLAGYGISRLSRASPGNSGRPVVTYISRQKTGRRLASEAHEGLVRSLRQLEEEGLCDVHIPVMEQLSLKEQIELASWTTILVGVHGNGLTVHLFVLSRYGSAYTQLTQHQLWMPPSTRATVIEIMIPEGYVYDYEILARNMGHKHYAIWNDTFVTYPVGQTHEGINYPEGFHGSSIPVHGPTVASIIRDRLTVAGDV